MKIVNDKYYTPIDLATSLIKKTFKILVDYGIKDITDVIRI